MSACRARCWPPPYSAIEDTTMERPLDIAFHGIDPSPAIEAEIRQRVQKLERRYGNLIACRVSIEALHNQHRTGNVHDVHIVLSVPGRDLAVSLCVREVVAYIGTEPLGARIVDSGSI